MHAHIPVHAYTYTNTHTNWFMKDINQYNFAVLPSDGACPQKSVPSLFSVTFSYTFLLLLSERPLPLFVS